ncbi:MAG TPA: hypothetical protein DIU15_06200, partial [Deltaproteobacteria bacterium]|nr:hypothetical protein [Deltaproteobacteria bacterium]
MDLSAAVAVSQCADRIERGCRLRAELVEAGSAAQWARRRAGGQQRRLPGFAEPSSPGVFDRFRAQSVCPVPWESAGYPAGLRHLAQPPPVLFVRGSSEPLPAPVRCVALVGARRCTELGRLVARDLAAALARAGVVVVSGLAMGIDAAAHEGALDAGGQTIA